MFWVIAVAVLAICGVIFYWVRRDRGLVQGSAREAIHKIATCPWPTNEFTQLARETSKRFSVSEICEAANTPALAGSLAKRIEQTTAWECACLEVLGNQGEAAVEEVARVALGPRAFSKAFAIEVLCRMAAQGLKTEEIIQRICDHLPDCDWEALMEAVGFVSEHFGDDSRVQATLESLLLTFLDPQEPNYPTPGFVSTGGEVCGPSRPWGYPVEALSVMEALVPNRPDIVGKNVNFLWAVANGHGLESRTPLHDGAVRITLSKGESYERRLAEPLPEKWHRIRAAMLMAVVGWSRELAAMLKDWERTHPDSNVRETIRTFLEHRRMAGLPED